MIYSYWLVQVYFPTSQAVLHQPSQPADHHHVPGVGAIRGGAAVGRLRLPRGTQGLPGQGRGDPIRSSFHFPKEKNISVLVPGHLEVQRGRLLLPDLPAVQHDTHHRVHVLRHQDEKGGGVFETLLLFLLFLLILFRLRLFQVLLFLLLIFFVIPGAWLSRTPSLSGTLDTSLQPGGGV